MIDQNFKCEELCERFKLVQGSLLVTRSYGVFLIVDVKSNVYSRDNAGVNIQLKWYYIELILLSSNSSCPLKFHVFSEYDLNDIVVIARAGK